MTVSVDAGPVGFGGMQGVGFGEGAGKETSWGRSSHMSSKQSLGDGSVRGKEQVQMGHCKEMINKIWGLLEGSKTNMGLLGDSRWQKWRRPRRKYVLVYG